MECYDLSKTTVFDIAGSCVRALRDPLPGEVYLNTPGECVASAGFPHGIEDGAECEITVPALRTSLD